MIAIVGAGITGLTLAHELAKRDADFLVLEATDRPGGVIRSSRVESRVAEWGPQRGRLTADLAELVEELGLAGERLQAPADLPLYVYADGALREVPFSMGALLAGDLLTWRGKLRLALEPLTDGPRADERVADLLVRKIGREAYERLAGPLYGGLYASDPADMVVGLSLGRTLRELGVRRSLVLSFLRRRGTDSPAAFSFRQGLQSLTDALHAAHALRVRLEAPVRGLARSKTGWRIELDGEGVEAESVVLTCPAPVAARILERAAPEAADRLARLVYNPLAVVQLEAETDLRGFGYQVALGEALATRGVTWHDSLFGREDLYTAFLGGAKAPGLVEEPDERLGQIAAREFEAVTGRPARLLAVGRTSMPAWDVSWRALEGLELPPGIRVSANWESRPGIPGRLASARRLAAELSERTGALSPVGSRPYRGARES